MLPNMMPVAILNVDNENIKISNANTGLVVGRLPEFVEQVLCYIQ